MNNNQKATKRALLTSVMALVMCVVMLVGTTFAWFTDTASTGVNKIVSGNLKVDIIEKDSDDHIEKLNFTKAAGAPDGEQLLWEPGCRYLTEGFRIANKGNLALKWKAQVNKGATEANEGNFDLLDVIDFYLVTKAADGAETATALDEFTGNLKKTETSEVYYIKGVMQTTAGNDYQGLTLDGITITVVATQDTVENDSYGNQYDKDAEIVAVTPDTIAAVDFTKSNAVYHFAAGSYSGTTLTVRDNTNTVFEAADGATFDNVTIKYAATRYGVTDKSDSSMTIKGFNVTGVLDVNCADGKLVVENNTAQKIKVTMNRQDGKENADIQFKDNKLNGGKYGIELVPNHSGYTLTISGNEFTNITNHAISVMGYQSDLSASDETRTAAASITVSGNTFNSYGAGKAAFKIWGDTNLAPNGTDALTEAAQVLADSVKANNTFGSDLDNTCVVADFFGKKVTFN
mgnify:FL=1